MDTNDLKKNVEGSCISKFTFKPQNISQIGQSASHFSETTKPGFRFQKLFSSLAVYIYVCVYVCMCVCVCVCVYIYIYICLNLTSRMMLLLSLMIFLCKYGNVPTTRQNVTSLLSPSLFTPPSVEVCWLLSQHMLPHFASSEHFISNRWLCASK